MKISNDMPIEVLDLSTRLFNVLKRNNINSVGEFMELSEDDVRGFSNAGAKTVDELRSVQASISFNGLETSELSAEVEVISMHPSVLNVLDERSSSEEYAEFLFADDDGLLNEDLSVTVMDISNSKHGTLMRSGYSSLRQLTLEQESKFHAIKSLGSTYDTVLNELAKRLIIYYPVNQTFETAKEVANLLASEYSLSEDRLGLLKNALRARIYEYENQISYESYDDLLANRGLLTFLYRDELVRRLVEEYILGMIGDSTVDYFDIRKMVPHSIISSCRLDDILFEMKTKNLIEESEEGYQKFLPYLVDWIRTGLTKDKEKDVVRKRISGMTLEEIGEEYGITRERIRQIEAKAKKRFVHYKEERYVYWFNNYSFTKKQFCNVFNLLPASYDSVKYLAGSAETKQKPVVDALNDDKLTPAMSKRFRRVLSDMYFLFEDEYVVIKESPLLEAILRKNHSDSSVRISDLIHEYNSVVSENNLDLNLIGEDEDRRIESKVMHFRNSIKREKHSFRYYEYDNYDFEEFFKSIDFSTFMNTEISTQKIMNMYPELMEQYDIKASYELHFIIQKYTDLANKYNIEKQTAPYIIVGTASRELQVRRFIYKVAPISIEDFGKAYEAEYGIEAPTVLGTYYIYYNDYVKDGRVIDVTQEPMRDDELFMMKSALIEDFYFLEDVEKKYRELFPDGNTEKINHYNLKKLGFKVNSTYAFRNTFNNVDDCFCSMFMKHDGIAGDVFDRRFVNVQQYYTSRDKMRRNYDLLEIRDGEYITFEKFQEVHPDVTKKELKDYAKKAIEFASSDIFTVYSLRKAGFVHKLDELREPEIFYAGLIGVDRSVYNSRTSGDVYFSKTNSSINKPAFVRNALLEMNQRSVDIIKLMDYMMEEYGVYIARKDIPRFVKEKGYYYLPDTEKIYLTEEEYLKDIV